VGEKVKLTAATEGYPGGTPAKIQVFRRDLHGPDVVADEIETTVKGDKVEAEWTYTAPGEEHAASSGAPPEYSSPEYYFEVLVNSSKTRSGLLYFEDYIEIELKDENGKPMANEEYILYLPDGSVRKGKLDGSGKKKEEKVPSGLCSVKFPNLPAIGEG
jgi:hypothetical protein